MSYIHELAAMRGADYMPSGTQAFAVEQACAEVDRLRADVALATETITKCHKWIEDAKPLLERGGEAERQLAALTAERDELRKVLADMLAGWRYIRNTHGDLSGVGWERCEQSAQAALRATPPGGAGENAGARREET